MVSRALSQSYGQWIVGIIAYLTFRAAFSNNSNESGGTSEAFDFLQNEFGALMLGIIASGLFLYGVFTLIMARHRRIDV